MTTQTRCRAKDPSTCTYHVDGRVLSPDKEFYVQQMERAQLDTDFEAYGKAYAELKRIEDAEATNPDQLAHTENLFADALEMAGREKLASVQDRALLYARIPNEGEGEAIWGFFRRHKHNNAAIVASKNPYMYRVVGSNLEVFQPSAEMATTIATSGDHRARLLLASNLRLNENAVKGRLTPLLQALAKDEDPEIRAYTARVASIMAHADLVADLSNDPVRDVRYALASNEHLSRDAADRLRHDNDNEIKKIAEATITRLDTAKREYEEREARRIREHEAARANGTLPWYEDEDYYGPGSGYDEHGVYHASDDDS